MPGIRIVASIIVNKLECAKRQLETAIVLFFDDGDPVSIHTLVCAAYQLVFDINKDRGGKPMWVKERYLDIKPPETKSQVNLAQNFFKHATRNIDDSLDFDPDHTGAYLVDACRTYGDLTGNTPGPFKLFRAWFVCPGFDFPPEEQVFANELAALKAAGDRRGFFNCFLRRTARG